MSYSRSLDASGMNRVIKRKIAHDTPEPVTQPIVAIRLSKKLSHEAKTWLIERIVAEKSDYGCQLDVIQGGGTLLLISASTHRFLLGAEVIGLKKKYNDGTIREFTEADGGNFQDFYDDGFLLESECFQIIKHELNGLSTFQEIVVPGHPTISIQAGKSIVQRLLYEDLINDVIPLHNQANLSAFKGIWYQERSLYSFYLPLHAIHQYFGQTIGIYFAFLNFYTIGLIPLVVWACFVDLFRKPGGKAEVTIAVLVSFWSTILLELWKRAANTYLYTWGCLEENKEWEEPRLGFHGVMSINPVNGKKEPFYPSWRRYMRICFITTPIIVLSLGLSVLLMFYYFSWEIRFKEIYTEDDVFSSLMKNIPCIVYSILVIVADMLYRVLAEWLTVLENHKMESTFQNHLIFKIVVFVFTNNFLVLFYVAFVYNDLPMLRMLSTAGRLGGGRPFILSLIGLPRRSDGGDMNWAGSGLLIGVDTLRNLFLVHIFLSQTLESLIPYWRFKVRSDTFVQFLSTDQGVTLSGMVNEANLKKAEQAKLELNRVKYPGTFDDYIELWLQFGYVVLFLSVYPEAAFFAFFNNIIEERSDAFKLCSIYQRPFPGSESGITAWQVAFQSLSYLAIVSNLALVFQLTSFNSVVLRFYPSLTSTEFLGLFLLCEHLLLFLRWTISLVVPDIPESVKTEIAKIKYVSLEALKNQRSLSLRTPETFHLESQMFEHQ